MFPSLGRGIDLQANGTATISDYIDVWNMTLEAGSTYVFTMENDLDLNGQGFSYLLHGPSATKVFEDPYLEFAWTDSEKTGYMIITPTESGKYYLSALSGNLSEEMELNYTIKGEKLSQPVTNTDISTAKNVTQDLTTTGYLNSNYNGHVYAVELSAGESITSEVSKLSPSNGYLRLELFEQNALTIFPWNTGYVNPIVNGNEISYTAETDGIFYLAVLNEGPSVKYELNIDVEKNSSPPIVESKIIQDTDSNIRYSGS